MLAAVLGVTFCVWKDYGVFDDDDFMREREKDVCVCVCSCTCAKIPYLQTYTHTHTHTVLQSAATQATRQICREKNKTRISERKTGVWKDIKQAGQSRKS